MHRIQILLMFFSCLGFAGLKAKSLKVYKGPEGEKITIVRLEKGKEALVKVENTESDFDNKTLLVEIKTWGDNEDYKTRWNGSSYNMLTKRNGKLEIYPPQKKSILLSYDDKKTDSANAEQIVTDYEKASASQKSQ